MKEKLKIVYAGKFAPEWGIRELFHFFRELQKKIDVELHIYGDKVHDPKDDPTFKPEVLASLQDTEGVIWHGRKNREQVLTAMAEFDIAWGWRHASLEEHTLELSTKLLEYASAELPILLHPNDMYKRLIGSDYPLFSNNVLEFVAMLSGDNVTKRLNHACTLLKALADGHTFKAVAEKYLDPIQSTLLSNKQNGKTIVIAGHDLKFIKGIESHLRAQGHNVLIDQWKGHNSHNPKRSEKLASIADVIICEWCMGNTVFYTKRKNSNQKIIVRFHLQEINTQYPLDIDMDNVDHLIFVSHHLKRDVLQKFDWKDCEKFHVVPNYVYEADLDLPKYSGAEFNLGLVGIVPERKRLDRGLTILEKLRQHDKRYQLYIKGMQPSDYAWMKNRKEEMAYYDKQFDRIKSSKWLTGAVHFDGFGNDVVHWYRKIGFVLSTSDFESFHLTVADGAASRAIPIILPWVGADEIYPAEWVVKDEIDAAKMIIISNEHFADNGQHCREYVVNNFSRIVVQKEIDKMIFGDAN